MEHDSALVLAAPCDAVGWVAFALALAAFVLIPRFGSFLSRVPWGWVAFWAGMASLVSIGYVHYYLGGGARIIDATSYWLEARAMSQGVLTWPLSEPSAAFRGRFLLHHLDGSQVLRAGVIFPPGYPAVLALGFLVGVPLLIGPALAALLVVCTAALAREASGSEQVARLAAVLAALNACLRYHTADTMSHGLAALCLTAAILFGFRAFGTVDPRRRFLLLVLCGLAAGWLVATRPVSGLALFCAGIPALFVARKSLGPHAWAALFLGLIAPLALFVAHQQALTGQWLVPSQQAYYQVADGPPGCFRYGFGQGIGCLVEHAPYVTSVLPDGYGVLEALHTSGRRLLFHVSDVANFAPFAIVVPIGVWLGRKKGKILILAAVPVSLLFAYAPFYFDGNYPGGGARLLADALPVEQVLAAVAVGAWAQRFQNAPRGFGWALGIVVAALLGGFALHTSHHALALKARDGGRPFFETSVVEQALGPHAKGLLFIESDHGFNLAFDPHTTDPKAGLVIARARGGDLDRLTWEHLQRPPTWQYVFQIQSGALTIPRVVPWTPQERADRWRFETEAEWPPLTQSGGYAVPSYLDPQSCVSSGRALALVKSSAPQVCVEVSVPFPGPGHWSVRPWIVVDGPLSLQVEVVNASGQRSILPLPKVLKPSQWSGVQRSESDGRSCVPLPGAEVTSGDGRAGRLKVCTTAGWSAVDRIEVSARP